jgi:hypothetical protein
MVHSFGQVYCITISAKRQPVYNDYEYFFKETQQESARNLVRPLSPHRYFDDCASVYVAIVRIEIQTRRRFTGAAFSFRSPSPTSTP